MPEKVRKTELPERWKRRTFLKACGAVLAGPTLPGAALAEWWGGGELHAQSQRSTDKKRSRSVLESANPILGTGWRGHMFPGATVPFGLVQLSPDSSGLPDAKWNIQGDWYEWQHCSGYNYRDNVINGFSHTHIQGAGGIDLGDVLVMPIVEGKNWSWDPGKIDVLNEMQIEALGTDTGIVFSPSELGYRSFFSHEREAARPGYYSVHLQTPDVQAEMTATTRCGMHRYRYLASPSGERQGLVVDLAHGLNCRVYAAELTVESNGRITGQRSTHGWAQDRHVYFVMELSHPAIAVEVNVDGAIATAQPGSHFSGREIKVIFTRKPSSDPLLVRVGISPVSQEGAAKNLQAEIPVWDFDAVVHQASKSWADALSTIDASFSKSSLEETFYSNVYHSLVAPATYNDGDGAFRGQDGQNHPNPGFTKYTTLSIWDIYRGEFPLITLMEPRRVNDIVRTLVLDYQQLGQHALPMWPLWGNETWSMIGFHAAGMILGAYAAIRDTALVGAETKGNRTLQAMFRQYGYVPSDLHGGGVSSTLDLSYDYWCAGAIAELLGKKDDSAMFYKLGQNYRNVFNPATGFMQGRSKEGKWRDPFRPDQELDDYVESDAWQASFSVPHDVQGLISLYGGDAAFVDKLEGLFTAPSRVIDARPDVTGMVGQDAQGNEPSTHHPYLFSFAGAAWKTQYWSRKVAALYNNTPAGIPSNDDYGQLSSWFVFAALGFYPVNAATGVYVFGSPLVDRATILNPSTGSKFTIIAENNSPENVFIQRAELNGKEFHRSWLSHQQITAGGELRFQMGRTPNKDWAAAPADRPPSGLIPA
jgi:predicted alpha-1,2-mannosidase